MFGTHADKSVKVTVCPEQIKEALVEKLATGALTGVKAKFELAKKVALGPEHAANALVF